MKHTDETQALLTQGKRAEAIERHNARVESELKRARAGEVINLSDLMAASEEITADAIRLSEVARERAADMRHDYLQDWSGEELESDDVF